MRMPRRRPLRGHAARRGLCISIAALAGSGLGGCDTVDLGPPPPELNACRPSETFFYERIWPEFLGKDFQGKRCGDRGCHDAASPRQLIIPSPTSPPGQPLPEDWQLAYRSAADQVFCTNAAASPLAVRPSQSGHGVGALIDAGGAEAAMVRAWVEAR